MKGITLFAIDKNYKNAGPTVGMDALRIEKSADGNFELVDPISLGSRLIGYVSHRSVSVLFKNLHDLVEKIENFPGFSKESFQDPIEPGGILLLVIVCHGRPGTLFMDGVDANGVNTTAYLTASTLAKYASDLARLGKYLAARDGSKGVQKRFATVRFDGCNAGADSSDPHEPHGSELLLGLSRVWPGTRIVAFADYGIGRGSKTAPFRFQGAEDSNVYFDDTKAEPEFGFWDAALHSWRSENSPNAKIAQDGAIVSRPAHEIFAQPFETVVRQMKTRTLDQSTVEAYGIGGAAPRGAYALPAPTGTAGKLFQSARNSP